MLTTSWALECSRHRGRSNARACSRHRGHLIHNSSLKEDLWTTILPNKPYAKKLFAVAYKENARATSVATYSALAVGSTNGGLSTASSPAPISPIARVRHTARPSN